MVDHEVGSQHDLLIITPPSTPPTPNPNPLSDIFSDSPPTSPSLTSPITEPSDIPRLRSTHSTAGYRAGISTSKTEALQPGFDEGYSLGATFGLRAGYLLGVLEGLHATFTKACSKAAERMGKLVLEAKKELELEKLFGKEWWSEDGVWKYAVHGDESHECKGDSEITFQEVVDCHPLVHKWDAIVDQEMENAGLDKRKFEGAEWERGRLGVTEVG